MIQDQDEDPFIFVLESPRDQDPGLEDYITETVKAETKYSAL